MSTLVILDCSNYIYQGTYSRQYISRGVRQVDGVYKANDAPIGGVNFLLKNIKELQSADTTIVPVFDRPPTIKREMYNSCFGHQDYKGNRGKKDVTITLQQSYAEQILRDIGFNVQAADGYEADDLIYSFIQEYGEDFDYIEVHTRDSDLSFLVNAKTTIEPVGKTGKHIDIYNYEHLVYSKEDIQYNSSQLWKMALGDTSDNIPGVGRKFLIELYKYLTMDTIKKCGDLDFCRKLIMQVVEDHPFVENASIALQVFNIVSPLRVPSYVLNFDDVELDKGKLLYYTSGFDKTLDNYGCEGLLMDYIDQYYD